MIHVTIKQLLAHYYLPKILNISVGCCVLCGGVYANHFKISCFAFQTACSLMGFKFLMFSWTSIINQYNYWGHGMAKPLRIKFGGIYYLITIVHALIYVC